MSAGKFILEVAQDADFVRLLTFKDRDNSVDPVVDTRLDLTGCTIFGWVKREDGAADPIPIEFTLGDQTDVDTKGDVDMLIDKDYTALMYVSRSYEDQKRRPEWRHYIYMIDSGGRVTDELYGPVWVRAK